ncbi:S53 family peptidase [Streptomyces sp. NPDC003703]|uniref:S53 family peptidase n=1 Tax=Streptomyces sp. NPDC003283 TaxID=3364681 RepID=UPI0036801917
MSPSSQSRPVELVLTVRRRRQLPDHLVAGPATLSRDELAAGYGADPADIALARSVLERAGLRVTESDAASRRVVVRGEPALVDEVFGTGTGRHDDGRTHPRPPAELGEVVRAVVGPGTRPLATPLFRSTPGQPQLSYTPPELGSLYGFPEGTDGSGQVLAVVTVDGGWRRTDLDAYFAGLGLRTPDIRAVGVGGAANSPGPADAPPSPADIEAALDIQVAGALAPGARLVHYFAPNTGSGILDTLRAAVHATPTPTVISLSWGSSEQVNPPDFVTAVEDLFQEAAALGITVCAAAGDAGSGNGEGDGGAHVNYPASSPHVLAVGGTTLVADPADGAVRAETTWNAGAARATGGGVSALFPRPGWQEHAGVPDRFGEGGTGRGVPDVAADADGGTGYQVLINGRSVVVGGTSPAAPLWAALVCRLAQALGRPLGLLQPHLYRDLVPGKVPAGFRDVVSGDNGAYAAAPGWDPNTGLGSPDGTALLDVLRSRTAAGPTA